MCEMLPKQNGDLAKKTSVLHFQVKKREKNNASIARAGREETLEILAILWNILGVCIVEISWVWFQKQQN